MALCNAAGVGELGTLRRVLEPANAAGQGQGNIRRGSHRAGVRAQEDLNLPTPVLLKVDHPLGICQPCSVHTIKTQLEVMCQNGQILCNGVYTNDRTVCTHRELNNNGKLVGFVLN